jgi:hypothetical protein
MILHHKNKSQDNIEEFNQVDIQNGCHMACSSINWVNIILLLVIIALLYQYLYSIKLTMTV